MRAGDSGNGREGSRAEEMGETSPLSSAIVKGYSDAVAADVTRASTFEELTLEERQLRDEQRCVRATKVRVW